MPGSHHDELLRLQREANQMLLLAGIRAQEDVDDAVDARRRAETETSALRSSTEELRVTAEFRELLIGILGHDLRNPLNTVVMASGLLLARGELGEQDARLVNRIVTSGQRMARMISQLASFTRARLGGGFELRLAPSDLGDICRDIAEELRISSSVEIRQTIEGDLRGTWDADRLAEVISNIAGNAVDHAAPGTPVLIHAHDEAGGEAVIAEITNEGPCIPADVLPVIFKAFRRAEANASADTGHLGLGLYVACQIVRSHGGSLDVRSSDGTTTFTVRLPRASAPAS